tara:strand:+ start:3330 stop:3782 length:453 start_codon:yes stop_codon:yes gene_type:complete
MTKNIIKTLIFIIICACSYEPILSNKKYNFELVNIYFKGDDKINKIIRNDLATKSNGSIKYDLQFETVKFKEVLSSNEKGDPTVYKIKIDTSYSLLKENKKILVNKISKQIVYNNIDDKFELSQYEDRIINNLAYNISSEILMSVTALSK